MREKLDLARSPELDQGGQVRTSSGLGAPGVGARRQSSGDACDFYLNLAMKSSMGMAARV